MLECKQDCLGEGGGPNNNVPYSGPATPSLDELRNSRASDEDSRSRSNSFESRATRESDEDSSRTNEDNDDFGDDDSGSLLKAYNDRDFRTRGRSSGRKRSKSRKQRSVESNSDSNYQD